MSDFCRPNGTPGKSHLPKPTPQQSASVQTSRNARHDQRSALYAALREKQITSQEFGARMREVGFH